MPETPILSICIPTYNNLNGVKRNLNHLLDGLDDDRFEIVIGDDGSDEDIQKAISGYRHDNVIFYQNNKNLGPVQNMLKTYNNSSGKYVLFQSDEDKLDIKNLYWLVEKLEEEDNLNVIIGGNGGSSWNDYCPDLPKIADGEEALILYAQEFNEKPYSWSKSYGGGFVLRKSALNLDHLEDRLEEYPVPHYTINIPILEALSEGGLLFTDRHINNKHYWNYKGGDGNQGHRTWKRIGDKYSTEVEIKGHHQRMKYIFEDISSETVRREFLEIEKQWAAQVTAWAIISPTLNFRDVRAQFLTTDDKYVIPEFYSSVDFWTNTVRYLFLYLIPIYNPKMHNRPESDKYPKRRASAVWWFCIGKRILPDKLADRLEKTLRPLLPLFSLNFWWKSVFEKIIPDTHHDKIKEIYHR